MHLKVKPSTDGSGFDIPANVNLCNLPPGILPGDLEGVPEDILRENFPEIFEGVDGGDGDGGDEDSGGGSSEEEGSLDPVALGLPADINLDNLPAGITADDLVGLPEYILREEFPELFEETLDDYDDEDEDEGSNLPEGINLANLPAGITVCMYSALQICRREVA